MKTIKQTFIFVLIVTLFSCSKDKIEINSEPQDVVESNTEEEGNYSTSVKKGGITWSFNKTLTGTFVDGSPWVVSDGNINLTATLPASKKGRNGGFVNPNSTFGNGVDDRMKFNDYKHEENLISSEKLPRKLIPGESYLKAISKEVDAPGDNSDLEEIQVLTVRV